MSNKRIPVGVNGEYCRGVKEAAERVSLISGRKISGIWLSRKIRKDGPFVLKGVAISTADPKLEELPELPAAKEPEREMPPAYGWPPLLRYPLGKAPIDRGVCRPEI
jgi:hypothetical protein